MHGRHLLGPALACLALALAASGCGGGGGGTGAAGGGDGGTNTWVGKLDGSDVYIAIMKQELAHLVYITDGKEIALWFKGNVGLAGAGYFVFQDHERRAVEARPQGNNYAGRVTLGPGQHVQFTAVPAKGEAGLYRDKETLDGETWQSGWIVLEDGSLRGARVTEEGRVVGHATLGGTRWTDPTTEP